MNHATSSKKIKHSYKYCTHLFKGVQTSHINGTSKKQFFSIRYAHIYIYIKPKLIVHEN